MSSTSHPAQGQLHAVHVLSTVAGAHVSSLAGGLVARGVEVTVCGPAAAEADYGFAGTGARFAPVDLGRRVAADAPAVAVLRAACTGASVVHAHGLRAGLLAAVRTRRPRHAARRHLARHRHPGRRAQRHAGALAGAARGARRPPWCSASPPIWSTGPARIGARDVRLAPAAVPRPQARPPRPPADGDRRTAEDPGRIRRGRPPVAARRRPARAGQGYDLLLDAAGHWAHHELQPLLAVAGEGAAAGRAAAPHRGREAAGAAARPARRRAGTAGGGRPGGAAQPLGGPRADRPGGAARRGAAGRHGGRRHARTRRRGRGPRALR